jgi:hypothetical protein
VNIVASSEPLIQDVRITGDEIIVQLSDGRVVSVPLAWSWRLFEATPAQRANWRLIGNGQGVHWPEIDEDLSAEGLLHGAPSYRSFSPADQKGTGRKPANKRVRARRTGAQLRRGVGPGTERPR